MLIDLVDIFCISHYLHEWFIFMVSVGKYTIHGSFGILIISLFDPNETVHEGRKGKESNLFEAGLLFMFLFLGTNIGNIPIVVLKSKAQGTRKRGQEGITTKLVFRNISKKKYPDVSNSICFSYPIGCVGMTYSLMFPLKSTIHVGKIYSHGIL